MSYFQTIAIGVCVVCGLGARQAGEPITPPVVRTLASIILALDRDALTLKLADADPDDLFAAGPALRADFALRAIGDRINVTFYEARVVAILVGGGGGLPEGVRPDQGPGVRPFIVDATVSDVDFFGRSITVTFASGIVRTFAVVHESVLVGVSAGDIVTLTISRPLISRIEEP